MASLLTFWQMMLRYIEVDRNCFIFMSFYNRKYYTLYQSSDVDIRSLDRTALVGWTKVFQTNSTENIWVTLTVMLIIGMRGFWNIFLTPSILTITERKITNFWDCFNSNNATQISVCHCHSVLIKDYHISNIHNQLHIEHSLILKLVSTHNYNFRLHQTYLQLYQNYPCHFNDPSTQENVNNREYS